MKTLVLFLLITTYNVLIAQDSGEKILDSPLGLRIIKNGQDYIVFVENNLDIDPNDYRKINYQVYFRKLSYPEKIFNGKKYQLITIPGSSKHQDQNNSQKNQKEKVSRIGNTISKEDYDRNFWIESEVIEKYTEMEYYKYASGVFSGLLTAPFKYRLKVSSSSDDLIDGDFNIAPFIGWKWRISSSQPYYFAPFGFAGITTLGFNSGNNSRIINPEQNENGVGLTYGLGISFKFGNVSPGFVIGWDKGFGNIGNGFNYNDKPWISFSVNYDFFKPKQTEDKNK